MDEGADVIEVDRGAPGAAGARRCARCTLDKPLAAFSNARHAYCRVCYREYQRLRRAELAAARPPAPMAMSAAESRSRKNERWKRRYATDPEFRLRHLDRVRKHVAVKGRKRHRDREAARRQGRGSVVYFMRFPSGGPIKIGRTSCDAVDRARDLSTGHWEDLAVLGVIAGEAVLETELHFRFRHLAVKREWFRAEPDLLAYIAANAVPWDTFDGRGAEEEAERRRPQEART